MKRNAALIGLLSAFVLLLVWIKPVELADQQPAAAVAAAKENSQVESPEKTFDKRSSNWAKAGSMWGKRSDDEADDEENADSDASPEEMTKRGWEKAGSMWGKRNANNNWSKASSMWGKRTKNDWSKASSMWGKRR